MLFMKLSLSEAAAGDGGRGGCGGDGGRETTAYPRREGEAERSAHPSREGTTPHPSGAGAMAVQH